MNASFEEHPHGQIVLAVAQQFLQRMEEATQVYDTVAGALSSEKLQERGLEADMKLGYLVGDYSVLLLEFRATSTGVNPQQFVHHEVPKEHVLELSQIREAMEEFVALHQGQLYPGTDMPFQEVHAWVNRLLRALELYCVGVAFMPDSQSEDTLPHMRDLFAVMFLLKDDWEQDRSTQRVLQLVWSGPDRVRDAIALAKTNPTPGSVPGVPSEE